MQDRIFILREKCIKVTQILTGKGILVTQRGVEAFVQSNKHGVPVRVNLPFVGESASDALIVAIEGFLDHEVAHILFSNFKLLQKSAAVSKRFGAMHNITEDTFIERKMSERFPGSAHNITKTQEFFCEHFLDGHIAAEKLNPSPGAAQAALVVPLIRMLAGQRVLRDWMTPHMPIIAELYAKLKDLGPRLEKAQSTHDTYLIAEEIVDRMTKKEPPKRAESSKCGKEGKGESTEKGKGEGKPKPGDKCEGDPSKSDKEGKGAKTEKGEAGESSGGKSEKGEKPEPKEKAAPKDKGEPKDEPTPGEDDEGEGEPKKEEPTPGEAGEPKKDETETPTPEEGEGEGEGALEFPEDDEDEDEGKPSAGGSDPDDDDIDPDADDPHGEKAEGSGEGSDDGDDGASGAEGAGAEEGTSSGAHDMTALTEAEPNPLELVLESAIAAGGFDERIAEMITGAAVDAALSEPYLPYTKDHDIIEPISLGAGQRAVLEPYIKGLDDDVLHMVGVMQKDLERAIQARSRVVWNPGLRRGRLNGAALSRLAVNDDRVFRRKEESTSKDVAVTLLVDLSGSMTHGSKIKTAVQAAYALSQTLDRISIKNEVLGFTTQGMERSMTEEYYTAERRLKEGGRTRGFSRTERIYMPVFKDFQSRFDLDAKLALIAAYSGGYIHCANNIDGESVEYAAHRLAQRREKGKLLIVLSDGAPACSGDNAGGSRHLKNVVKKLPKMGIKVVGIGIMTTTIKDYYPKSLIINRVEELPAAVMKELRTLLLD